MKEFTEQTIAALEKKFDKGDIKSRKGSFGKNLSYIEGHSVIERLNKAFGQMWSFVIKDHLIESGHLIVTGELIIPVYNNEGQLVDRLAKQAYGGKPLTKLKDPKPGVSPYLDLAADFKAASTDALKKAATLLGVGLDLYSSDEKEVDTDEESAAVKEDPNKKASDAQTKAIATICKAKKLELADVLKKNGAPSLEALTESKAKDIIQYLNKTN